MQRLTRTLLAAAVVCLAAGALAGVAAADDPTDGTTIGADIDVDADGEGGEGGFTCEGALTDHDCDKGGEMNAGPAAVDYEGFNGGSLNDGEYAFGDTFVVTVDDEALVVGFICEFEDEPPEDNPCPVEFDESDDDHGNGQGNGNSDNDNGNSDNDNGNSDNDNGNSDNSERP